MNVLDIATDAIQTGAVPHRSGGSNQPCSLRFPVKGWLGAQRRRGRQNGRRVLYVASSPNLIGGAEHNLVDVVGAIVHRGWDPAVVVPSDGSTAEALRGLSVPVFVMEVGVLRHRAEARSPILFWRLFTAITGAIRMARLIREHDIDVVHSNTSGVIAGAIAARLAGVPHVWHVREILHGPVWALVRRLLFALGDRIVCISETVAAHVAGARDCGSQVVVIHDGINVELFSPSDDGPTECNVLMLSRMHPEKGHEVFVRAASIVARRFPKAQFFMFGDCLPVYEGIRRQLVEAIDGLGLSDRIHLRPGVSRANAAAMIRESRVVVVPSQWIEPGGLVVLEAMSSGVAVVAPNRGGPAEVVTDGVDGLLFPWADAGALARHIESLLLDEEAAARMGRASRERVLDEFRVEIQAERLEALYNTLIAGGERRPRLAILGARGVPGHYGGWDTVATELGPRLAERGFDVTVYCQPRYSLVDCPRYFSGVRLMYHPAIGRRTLESISHEALSMARAVFGRYDVIYILGTRASVLYVGVKWLKPSLYFNTDGHDWKRRKWGPLARSYLQWSEGLAVRINPDGLIADSQAIADYLSGRYRVSPKFIPYGAPEVGDHDEEPLRRHGLEAGRYVLAVCRIEPENNVDKMIAAYEQLTTTLPLVIVGGTNYESQYSKSICGMASEKVILLGWIFDPSQLNALLSQAFAYLHGHEVGGTNPSLLHAMAAGACVLAHDVVFNREVLGDAGLYWSSPTDLARRLQYLIDTPDTTEPLRAAARHRVREFYDWDRVADQHAALFRR